MIRLFLPLIFAIFSSSTMLTAQTLVFRSGEHDGFTRIVTSLTQDTEWSLNIEKNVLQLRFDEPFPIIDLSNVFQRINRNRILEIKKNPEDLGIDIILACECGFRAVLEDNSLLVIDIAETYSNLSSDADSILDRNLIASGTEDRDVAELPILFEKRHKHSPLTMTSSFRKLGESPKLSDLQTNELNKKKQKAENNLVNETLKINREALLARISSAKIEGLLIPKPSTDQVITELQDLSLKGETHPNLRTVSSSEIISSIEVADPVNKNNCLPKEDFDISSWGHKDGFATGLSMWRQLIMKEFDEIDAVAAIGLAKHYIHYGFGQEAQATLDLLSYPDPKIDHLRRMARIVDLGQDPSRSNTSWVTECGKEELLWFILSSERAPFLIDLEISAVQLAFEGLPQNLKQHLGPSLAEKFTLSGDNLTAESILASVRHDSANSNPAFEYAQASQDLSADDSTVARASLFTLLETNTEFSPLALIALVETAVAENQLIEDNMVDLVAAHLFENRHTELADDLSRAHILALAFSGKFSEALEDLILFEEATNVLDGNDTRSQIMVRLLNHADDIDFLAVVMGEPLTGLIPPIENQFAKRLLDLGFPETALEILAKPVDGEDGLNRRILRARAALLLNEPIVAEAELMGLSGEEVFSLRAAARRLRGDFDANPTDYSETYTEQQIKDLDWLAGNRPLVDPSDNQEAPTSLDQDGGRMFEPTQELAGSTLGMLGQAESLINDSSDTRIALQEVLSRFQLNAEPSQ